MLKIVPALFDRIKHGLRVIFITELVLFDRIKYGLLIIFIGAIIIHEFFSPLTGIKFSITPTKSPTPTAPAKQIMANSLPLQEIWRWSGLMPWGINEPPRIVIKKDMIVLLSVAKTRPYKTKIIALDARTGNLIWESRPISGAPDSLAVDKDNIYAGYPTYVGAYDLKTGQWLWRGAQQSRGRRGRLYVYATGERIEVYDYNVNEFPPHNRLFILDAETGITTETIDWSALFFRQANIYYTNFWC